MRDLRDRDRGLDRYIREISRHPLLTPTQESALAGRYRADASLDAGHQLVVANLRFVVKVAHEYRGYGMPLLDLIQEGNIGLMLAVRRFDPTKGYRLISYAVWWIRACIQTFVIRSWSLVKLGTTTAQRQLFYKVRSEREAADREAGPGATASLTTLAQRLGVAEKEIAAMELRLVGKDLSLDRPLGDEQAPTHVDRLQSAELPMEDHLATREEVHRVRRAVSSTMSVLNEKERYVVAHRLLTDEPETLRTIGQHFCVSRERIRQIEATTLRKLNSALAAAGGSTPTAARSV